jgi:hypothetical protein
MDAPRDLLESLVDDDPCWFDHHGGCQAHGYLSLEPGELCPQAELKALLAAPDPAEDAHDYLSTACRHDQCSQCRRTCKFCVALCRCGCHAAAPALDEDDGGKQR